MSSLTRRSRAAAWVAAGLIGGVGAGAIVAQLGVAGAADPTPAPSAPADPARPDGRPGLPGGPMGLGFGPEMAMGFGGRVLHGEATVKTADGDVQQVATQTGKITAVDGDTLSVRSSDDFTRDYAVDEDTRIALNGTDGALSSLTVGDAVHVVAKKTGDSWHAEVVLDGLPPRPMFGDHQRFDHRMPAPQPTATG